MLFDLFSCKEGDLLILYYKVEVVYGRFNLSRFEGIMGRLFIFVVFLILIICYFFFLVWIYNFTGSFF